MSIREKVDGFELRYAKPNEPEASSHIRYHNPDDLARAIREFEGALPGWWWSIGSCSVTAHASCGPDRNGGDAHLIVGRNAFDHGFHADLGEGTPADALRDVMKQAVSARSDARMGGV